MNSSSRSRNFKLTVDGIKKYYNFYNDNELILKTHFMSDPCCFEKLKFKVTCEISETNERRNPDKIKEHKITSEYLKTKMFKWRLMQTKQKNTINESEVLSDLSVNKKAVGFYPNFCKALCRECKQNCRFRLSHITDDMPVKQVDINEELKKHGHPKSRQRNGINRTLAEAKSELKQHYLTYHYNNPDL